MTNLSEELQAKAKWVADMMAADGVKAEQVTEEMAIAYMDAVGKKIEAIQNAYLTRNGAKEALSSFVLVAA